MPDETRAGSAAAAADDERALRDELRPRAVRVLAGPNLWRPAPAVVGELTLERLAERPELLRECAARLAPWLQDLPERDSGRPGEGWAALVARLAVGLQRRSGSAVEWWSVEPAIGADWVVAVEYEEEGVGTASVRAAAALLRDALRGDEPDVDGEIAELRARFERESPGPTSTVILAEARRRGIPVRRDPADPVVQLGLGSRRRRVDATLTERTPVIGTDITSDKDRTKRVLARLGVPVPRGGVAQTAADAVDIALDVGFPVLVKPLDANNGRGTSPRLDTEEEVREAFHVARAEHPVVVVERFVEGRDHRVLVVDGRVVAVAERVPAHVVGDGRRSIRELALEVNGDPRRSKTDPRAPLAPLPLDELTEVFLARGGRTLDTVPGAGETVHLRSTANISTGGIPIDRTDEIHPDNATVCAFAADVCGLDVAGIDVLTDDISVPFPENGATIIEVNASPGIRMHTEPERGTPRDVPGAVLDMLFPPGTSARIPVLAITGTNGKTTTTRLVAHLFRSAGHRTGFTTTDGVYYQDHVLMEGDMTGPMAADMILSHPRVDVAVLETARGGILRAGLGFDACDVSVVLNVTADHLGLKGIDTVERLADVKAVIVTATRPDGHAVLNADDPLVLAMRARTQASIVLFSLSGADESEAVREHLRAGGRAVTVEPGERDTIVLHRGAERLPLVAAADVPLSAGGAARFQVQNIIAAAGAAWAGGIAPEQIRAGLLAFSSSPGSTPGRMNLLEVRGARVVVDYAHNVAAIEALLDFARRAAPSRVLVALAMPGDRREDDMRAVGALAATADVAIFKEHPQYRRGREPGEITRIMREGFLAAGGDESHLVMALDEMNALDEVRQRLQPGDLVLFVADEYAKVLAEVQAMARTS